MNKTVPACGGEWLGIELNPVLGAILAGKPFSDIQRSPAIAV
jgi:hypothetical protein